MSEPEECGHTPEEHARARRESGQALAAFPPEVREYMRSALNDMLSAADEVPESDRDEAISRMRAEQHARENASVYIDGPSIKIRRNRKTEVAAQIAASLVWAGFFFFVVGPWLAAVVTDTISFFAIAAVFAVFTCVVFARIGGKLYFETRAFILMRRAGIHYRKMVKANRERGTK